MARGIWVNGCGKACPLPPLGGLGGAGHTGLGLAGLNEFTGAVSLDFRKAPFPHPTPHFKAPKIQKIRKKQVNTNTEVVHRASH